jgi:hypothetical protein
MLRFRDLLQFPPFYAKRNKSIRQVQISIQNIDRQENYIDISGVSKDYKSTIRIYGNININSRVSISCTCQSFNFEFAHALFRVQSLFNPNNFGDNLLKKPLDKNKYMIASGCKHIISLANLILKEKSRIGE